MKKILSIFLILIFFGIGFIISDGLIDDKFGEGRAYGIIYGNKIEGNGDPSNRLKARLNTGINLYNISKIQKIIVSGGVGIEGFDEALVMKEYLSNHGINEDDIIMDSNGYTTKKTSQNAFQIISISEENINEILVVGISQYFHISRVKLSLRNSGFNNVYGVAPRYIELRDFYSILREIPAYLKYKIL